MPEFEFDVDASIAAGWERFADRLAGLLGDLVPGATFDLAVPVPGTPSPGTPVVRFTGVPHGRVHAQVCGSGSDGGPGALHRTQREQLSALGWGPAGPTVPSGGPPTPLVVVPPARLTELAHLVAGTMERVFAVPHPVFLRDVPDDAAWQPPAPPPPSSTTEEADFRAQPITDPDQATRALGVALEEVYRRRVRPDEHDVFTVPAGCVPLFVRAHQSLPLIVFRSPLVTGVVDRAAAETEVAILNRDSLWCRYVFDGRNITAESELVYRVFVPVNFKIHLAELSAELDDVYPDLHRRVGGPPPPASGSEHPEPDPQ